jgi:DNA-binding response OmpR family regulator
LDYLQGTGEYSNRQRYPLPFLVLLDLKLPFVSGLELLRWIREQSILETIIIVFLTSSREDRDIDTAYRLGANSYLVKPATAQKLDEMVKSLGDYWLRHNEAPVKVGQPNQA